MKHIILCADDYGQHADISQGILELLKKNRLTAVSCMTNSLHWPTHAKWLDPFKNNIDCGLHFNLTEGKPLSKEIGTDFTSLLKLIIKAYSRQLNVIAIEAELNHQIDKFIIEIGRPPDFIDGHQHIHQLPIIRNAVLNVYEKRLRQSGCYIRCVNMPSACWEFQASDYFKILVIQLCGSFAFKKALIKHQIPHNTSFAGFYRFSDAKQYQTLFLNFLNICHDQGIIMCHPGLQSTEKNDSIARARYLEYQYFQSVQFEKQCAEKKIVLSRFKLTK